MITYILCAVLLATVSSNECDRSVCSEPIQSYYQTLNCTAVYADGACCPTSYDCTSLYAKRDKCYFNGVVYPTGSKLNGTAVGLPCDRCACQLRAGKASWNCTLMECLHWQSVPDRCRRVYMKDTCCPTGVYCDNDPPAAQGFVCQVGNLTFLEGQVFDPPGPGNKCKRCVCQRGFDGSFDGPWCRKKTCGFELRTKAIQDGCAPIFYAHKHCCPIDWQCPSREDRIVESSPAEEVTTSVTPGRCKFGNLLFNVSDKLFLEKRCLECTCSVPPHLTCIKKANCQECNPKHCNTPNLDLYRELNCTPIHENGECCPSSFDCSSVYENSDHCHFGGMLFHHKAELVGSDVGLPCEQCTCHVQDDKATWSCAIPECFNWPALPDQCHHIVTQDNCCPIGVLCDNNSTKVGSKSNKPFSCKVDGATYFEGHVFEPHGNEKPCKKCVCQRGFDGTFDGPWCDKLSCGYELHCWDKIQAGCVPVFQESEECCPTEWQCPSPTDTVIPATSSDLAPTSAQCVFGALRFNFLEMLGVSDHKCLVCTCYVPPILTCVHEPNCQEN